MRAAANEGGCTAGSAAIVIRPERITLQTPDEPVDTGRNVIAGTVAEVVYLGSSTQVHVDVGEPTRLVVEVANHAGPRSVASAPAARCTVCAPRTRCGC